MTKNQVHNILGNPPENKRFLISLTGFGYPPMYDFERPLEDGWQNIATWSNWIGDNGTLVVLFDAKDRVNRKALCHRARFRCTPGKWLALRLQVMYTTPTARLGK